MKLSNLMYRLNNPLAPLQPLQLIKIQIKQISYSCSWWNSQHLMAWKTCISWNVKVEVVVNYSCNSSSIEKPNTYEINMTIRYRLIMWLVWILVLNLSYRMPYSKVASNLQLEVRHWPLLFEISLKAFKQLLISL